ncbi:hypothetical protein BDZ94DRAFT_1311931 [Collybia nuda]|uniref:Uncharacterized protein n=1 Tax=Collybia nuda TaxID=64659 RepID=A0A9P5Y0B4_9AGAR|nr:hypothetical protein BDZ94DRAFT_1311931 [Collybia nuda]
MTTPIDILILGAGWTSTFLTPLCDVRSITYAATTRSGRDSTIPFTFIPLSEDPVPYSLLPDAHTVLITFPIEVPGASECLVRLYRESRTPGTWMSKKGATSFIQLGTSGIWDGTRKKLKDPGTAFQHTPKPISVAHKWYDRLTPHAATPRAIAEDELLKLSPETPTTVLNLAGLWGGSRDMRNWVGRVAPSKEVLRNKGSIHMLHGTDLARAILAVHSNFSKASGERWLITDGRVYDWWDLASAWGAPTVIDDSEHRREGDAVRGPHARWVQELMKESGVRALPRDVEALGRALDSREFWEVFGLSPIKARLEREWGC